MARNSIASFEDFLDEYYQHGDAIRACWAIGVCGFSTKVRGYIKFEDLTSDQIERLKHRSYEYLFRLNNLNSQTIATDRLLNNTKGTKEELKEHLFNVIRRYEMYPQDVSRRDSLTANQLLQQYFKDNGGDEKEIIVFKSYKNKSRKRDKNK